MSDANSFGVFRARALDENIIAMAALLDAGFDVNTLNESHETILHHCSANNRLCSAQFLAARGAELNASDASGATPLDWAVRYAASHDYRAWLTLAGGRTRASGHYAS
jgi:ankyrin repeat protein